ncbi:m74 [Muromegalovirus C4A]|uniref:M74 n=1 Tax=Muromegalovirus C4A TaxID=524649 RepID=B3UY01_MUHV1|nr:m74 [Muromegalovirus C4A]
MNPLLLMSIVTAASAAKVNSSIRKSLAYNPAVTGWIEMSEDDYEDGGYDTIDATEPPGEIQIGSSLVDNPPPPEKEPDVEEKENTQAKDYLSFTVNSVKFSKTWIRRRNRRPDNVFPIWYLIEGTEVASIKAYAGYYVNATYTPIKDNNNKTTKIGTVNVSGVPCGPSSSLSCHRSMGRDLITPKSNITAKYLKKCDTIFAAPILYDLPRWQVELRTPDRRVLVTESFTITTLAVATLISRYSRAKNEYCAKAFVSLYAIQHSVFKVTASWPDIKTFFDRFRHLKSQALAPAVTLPPRRKRSANSIVVTPPIPKNMHPVQFFYDFSAFMHASLYQSSKCALKTQFNTATVLTNGTVETVVGPVNVTTLYKSTAKKKPSIKDKKINLEDVETLDDVLMDYLDTLTLTASPWRTISQKPQQHVPSLPHKRRTGSISFSRV